MAGTKISLRDFLLGWIISDPTAGKTGSVGILGTTPVDSAGVEYNAANPMPISTSNISVVDATNSSVTPLAGGAAFTGTAKTITSYGSVTVSVFADQASATNGFSIQQGPDGTNWNFTDTFSVTASAGKTVTIPRQGSFLRVVYTNGATPNTVFRLQTILNAAMPAPSAVKPIDGTTFENDFQETLSVNMVSNGTTGDLQRAVANATNSTGTGITAAGLVAQLDDVAPTAISENSFGNVRMSSARALLVQEGPFAYGRVTADGQIKSGAGFIHTVTFSPTGAVTAGVATIYDSLTETGTVVLSVSLPVTTFTPFSVVLDVPTATGIFLGFDATLANVQVTFSYR